MAQTAAKIWNKTSPFGNVSRLVGLGKNSGVSNFLSPVDRITENVASGQPLTARSALDPAGAILQAPPKAPPPPPVFPDVEAATINARRNVRKRAVGGGVGSTILTGGYSPTGQASSMLGG